MQNFVISTLVSFDFFRARSKINEDVSMKGSRNVSVWSIMNHLLLSIEFDLIEFCRIYRILIYFCKKWYSNLLPLV